MGDESSGSAQLAFAILFGALGVPIDEIDEYEDFKSKFITPLKMGRTSRLKSMLGNHIHSTREFSNPEVSVKVCRNSPTQIERANHLEPDW